MIAVRTGGRYENAVDRCRPRRDADRDAHRPVVLPSPVPCTCCKRTIQGETGKARAEETRAALKELGRARWPQRRRHRGGKRLLNLVGNRKEGATVTEEIEEFEKSPGSFVRFSYPLCSGDCQRRNCRIQPLRRQNHCAVVKFIFEIPKFRPLIVEFGDEVVKLTRKSSNSTESRQIQVFPGDSPPIFDMRLRLDHRHRLHRILATSAKNLNLTSFLWI